MPTYDHLQPRLPGRGHEDEHGEDQEEERGGDPQGRRQQQIALQ
jgi:hypothetical protein